MRIQPIRSRYIHVDWQKAHELQPSASLVSGVCKLCSRPRAIADWRWVTTYSRARHLFPGYMQTAHGRMQSLTDDVSWTAAERVICFRGTQNVPVAARNERFTPPQRIVTRIIRDISRCPHEPVGSKFYCPAPYFYLPRDVGTCLSLSPELTLYRFLIWGWWYVINRHH